MRALRWARTPPIAEKLATALGAYRLFGTIGGGGGGIPSEPAPAEDAPTGVGPTGACPAAEGFPVGTLRSVPVPVLRMQSFTERSKPNCADRPRLGTSGVQLAENGVLACGCGL